ncbi:MAG TPA: hypothetical protein VNK24_02865 [Elusimicrobiota bacterium]|nr:hypothetical protein [Elusimicrobiota bacterium]
MTEWSGRLEGDAVWSGDVLVSGDVVVPPGAKLRVAAGTRVSFASRPKWSCAVFRAAPEGYPIEASDREACDLVVLGQLEVAGSPENPAVFGGQDAQWGGMIFLERAAATLQHCVIKVGTEYALQAFDDARLALEDCGLEEAQVGIASRGLSHVSILGGRVRAGRCGAVACEGSRITLDKTQILDSPQGLCAEDWALVRATGSRFTANRDFAVSARGYSWARFDGCDFEKSGETALRWEHARIDVR